MDLFAERFIFSAMVRCTIMLFAWCAEARYDGLIK
jgi:hypothetical protein